MIWEIVKYLSLTAFAYIIYICYNAEIEKRYYEKQGVKFCKWFPLVTDTFRLIMQAVKNPYDLPLVPYLKNGLGVETLPPFTGAMLFG